jgi:transposase
MRTHAPYSADFRAEAVRLALTSGQSHQAVARELGIAPDTLAVWIARAGGQERPGEALSPSEREELQQLRRENARLREEREILKKAAAFFAQESHSNR